MFSKEISVRVPACDCLREVAERSKLEVYGIPYTDVKIGHGAKFDYRDDSFEPHKIWVDLNYCPQCGKEFTKVDKKKK